MEFSTTIKVSTNIPLIVISSDNSVMGQANVKLFRSHGPFILFISWRTLKKSSKKIFLINRVYTYSREDNTKSMLFGVDYSLNELRRKFKSGWNLNKEKNLDQQQITAVMAGNGTF